MFKLKNFINLRDDVATRIGFVLILIKYLCFFVTYKNETVLSYLWLLVARNSGCKVAVYDVTKMLTVNVVLIIHI